MISLNFSEINLKFKQEKGKTFVFDPVRKRWLVLTPEEHVRQYMLGYLKEIMNYPLSLIAVEKRILVGTMMKRYDIVVHDRNHQPWMLIECKAPEVPISEKALNQLLQYHSTIPCSYWVLTNGHQTFCADACDVYAIKWLDQLPVYKG
ncbi:type I restriction enzyme HsdR N-terminal domain-containing protein [Polluticoccus soli]|uniref:type I restriction enzyme HsdR N-terminal domain-containing protein n=1 Tax=Polluticoccus soli TaxID=3034150 RepID=UPI0023E2A4B4|nr:type I restriction enzyme HsdR N-terminal domain-containing protein [Flavipsychrobacter sp. JY13-12]